MQKTIQNNRSRVEPKKGHQEDKYIGELDAKSGLRHGKGTYHYSNKYFTYTGQYNQGVKEGKGQLKLGDGTIIEGTFVNDQLCGFASIKYADGSWYKGELKNGEKDGEGHNWSQIEEYAGLYRENKREGNGTLRTSLANIEGEFKNNKPHGKCILKKHNYQYEGEFQNGKKHGEGVEECLDFENPYRYEGSFQKDQFEGEGTYSSKRYSYKGKFSQGIPALYPNQFKISIVQILKQENGEEQESEPTVAATIEYEVQSEMKLNILIESCYQAPEQLDQVQPTQEDIDKMIAQWQNQNKKNKNPPPMPDFAKPRMIKPDLVPVIEESRRKIQVKLIKQNGEEKLPMKIDYRSEIQKKRQEIEELRAEVKKEEDAGKKGGKKEAKGQGELKINLFTENFTENETILEIANEAGIGRVQKFELPDDFPLGNYTLQISSPFTTFGAVQSIQKQFIVKSKVPAKKK